MASVIKDFRIDAPADEVWDAIRDFGAVQQLFRALPQCRRRAGDRVGQIEILDRIGERRPLRDRRLFELGRRPVVGEQARLGELRKFGEQGPAKLAEIVERQRIADRVGERAQD